MKVLCKYLETNSCVLLLFIFILNNIIMEIGEKLQKLLDNKGITAYTLSEKTGVSQATLSRILKKHTKPNASTVKLLADYFKVDPDWFLSPNVEFSSHNNISEPSYRYTKIKDDVFLVDIDDEIEVFVNKNGIKFYEYPDGTTKIEVFKVPFNAYASYLEAFNDEEKLMNEFSTTTFTVDKVAKGNYVAFCTKNESMNGGGIDDTPGGAEVLARELGRHLWKSGFHKNKYGFILMTKSAIYHKDISNYNDETGMLTLSSRNPSEDDFEISINDVYRIFNVIKRTF